MERLPSARLEVLLERIVRELINISNRLERSEKAILVTKQ